MRFATRRRMRALSLAAVAIYSRIPNHKIMPFLTLVCTPCRAQHQSMFILILEHTIAMFVRRATIVWKT
jgi:hypothetical protein